MIEESHPAAPGTLESRDVDMIGYHDLAGRPGFKLAMTVEEDRWLLYLAHFWDSGWTILDVTDPTSPELVRFVEGPEATWTLQVQAAEGILLTGLEKPRPGWGREPGPGTREGVLLFDISGGRASDPVEIGAFEVGGAGTHRNHWEGGRYAYLTSAPDGFADQMLEVLDVSDPSAPRSVSRWWWPGQHIAGGEVPAHDRYLHGPAYPDGDLLYLGYGGVGMIILDVSDPSAPRLVSRLSFGDLGSIIGCHSVVPLHGTDWVVVNSEAIKEGTGEQLNYAFMVDVSDPTAPRIASWLPTPVPSPGLPYTNYFAKGGRFGPHNQHHYQNQPYLWRPTRHVVMTYFNAGLRVYDLADPLAPTECGFWVPEDPTHRYGPLPETLVSQSEDVLVDARGNIFVTDKNHGLAVLRYLPGLE